MNAPRVAAVEGMVVASVIDGANIIDIPLQPEQAIHMAIELLHKAGVAAFKQNPVRELYMISVEYAKGDIAGTAGVWRFPDMPKERQEKLVGMLKSMPGAEKAK